MKFYFHELAALVGPQFCNQKKKRKKERSGMKKSPIEEKEMENALENIKHAQKYQHSTTFNRLYYPFISVTLQHAFI